MKIIMQDRLPMLAITIVVSLASAQIDIITDETPLALRGACISNPCQHNGLCTITPNGFICTCVNGYVGVQCGRKADDCPRDNAMQCVHGICKLDMAGNAHCICNEGFDGPACSLSINNCASNPCMHGSTCTDKVIGFECSCFAGTSGSHCQIKEDNVRACIADCHNHPNDGKCWKDQLQNVTVGWGYGDLICNSRQTCFNMNKSEHSPYEFMEVQLKPVQMQYTDELVFITDRDAVLYDYNFVPHILPMEVNSKEAFLTCNTTHAVPLTNDPQMSRLNVNNSILRLGTQYFLADTNTLHRCLFGLRLNVTVKDRDCINPEENDGQVCSGHGKCFSDFNHMRFECLCCGGYYGDYCKYEDPCYVEPCANGAECKVVDYGSGILKHECICPNGFQGRSCSRVIDFCTNHPCDNGAACYTEVNGYRCQCKAGFSGKNCEINNDECSSSPCQNNGTCIDGLNNFRCICPSGFKGSICEVNIDECHQQPCINGTCLDLMNNYTCACASGFTGRNCEVQLNECESQPCVNGKCIKENEGFSCSCGIGYTGMLCELKLNLCQHSQYCIVRHSKTCVDLGNNVTCVCTDGWTGSNCAINKDDCVMNECMNNAMCIDKINGYECKCKKKFTGLYCEVDPPKVTPDIEIDFMTDNCHKFKDLREVHQLEQNIIALLRDACKCELNVESIQFGSTKVTCKDDMAGTFYTDLTVEDKEFQKNVVCGMMETIRTENTPNIYQNTYLISIADNNQLCQMKDKKAIPLMADGDYNNTGVIVGVLIGFLLMIGILIFVSTKIRNSRRKVGVVYKFEKDTIAFDNAAYGKGDIYEERLNQSSLDETTFTATQENGAPHDLTEEDLTNDITNDDVTRSENNDSNDLVFETKWAYSFDQSRKLYHRNGSNIPVGRLFDIHNPAGPSTNL